VPRPASVIGIVVALAAVVLVTRSPGHDDRPTGAKWGLLAGIAIGLFNVAIGNLSSAGAFGPLAVMRLVQACVLVGLIVAWRQPWRVRRGDVAKLAGVGLLDMAGNVSFILAAQTGALAIASVLSSLYPVTTVVLAIGVLRERLTRSHFVGILLTVVAIALISLGTAT
jgi:drug/metabolite transporter (DMT)-like permease